MFDYDWFCGGAYEQQRQDALLRLVLRKYPDLSRESVMGHDGGQAYMKELECRTLIYLRDGFSYEMKALAGEGPLHTDDLPRIGDPTALDPPSQ